jgi:hypothetical protein
LEGRRGQLHAHLPCDEYGWADSEEWNPSGYLWNVAQPVAVTISAQAPSIAETPPAATETPYPDGYKTACFSCHDEHMMQQQHLTGAQWDREINKMTGWGARSGPKIVKRF